MYLHSGNLTAGHGLSLSQPSSGGSYHVSEEDEYLLHRIGGGGSHVIESKRLQSCSPPGRLSGSAGICSITNTTSALATSPTGAIAAQPRSAAGQSSHALSGSAPTSSGSSVGVFAFASLHQRQQHLQQLSHPQQLYPYLNHQHPLASHSTPSLQLCDRSPYDGGPCTDLKYSPHHPNINLNLEPPMDPLTRFLSLHPQYQDPFNRLHSFLLNGDGPLPYTVRHYIGIMVSIVFHSFFPI